MQDLIDEMYEGLTEEEIERKFPKLGKHSTDFGTQVSADCVRTVCCSVCDCSHSPDLGSCPDCDY